MNTRRKFITLLGGVVAAWPLAAHAQQPRKLPTIGVLGPNGALDSRRVVAFVQRLGELGWIEGRNAGARTERLTEFAAKFVRLQVDVIVSRQPPSIAAKT